VTILGIFMNWGLQLVPEVQTVKLSTPEFLNDHIILSMLGVRYDTIE